MKCTGQTDLEGLRHPSKYLAQVNEREELFAKGWSIVKDKVLALTGEGILKDRRGDTRAFSSYKGSVTYFYLIHLAISIRSSIDPRTIDKRCNITEWEDRIKCVEESLMCIGKQYRSEYKNIFNDLLVAFGLHRGNTDCDEEDCCIGISDMAIGDNNCFALTLDEC